MRWNLLWEIGIQDRDRARTHARSSRQHRDGGTLGEREGETTRELASCTEEEEGNLVGGVVPIQACERGSEDRGQAPRTADGREREA